MEALRDATISVANLVFQGYSNKQKRDNVRFLHSMTIFLLAMLFIFAPSRSWARILSFSLYILFIILYVTLGDCWVYVVENEFEKVENDGGILTPLRTLLGFPEDEYTQRIFTSLGYFFACFIGSCFMVRDSFGIY